MIAFLEDRKIRDLIRLVAITLVVSFLAYDISWAYPDALSAGHSQNNKLAPQSLFKDEKFQLYSDAKYLEMLVEHTNAEIGWDLRLDALKGLLEGWSKEAWFKRSLGYPEREYKDRDEVLISISPGFMVRYYEPKIVNGVDVNKDRYGERARETYCINNHLNKQLLIMKELTEPKPPAEEKETKIVQELISDESGQATTAFALKFGAVAIIACLVYLLVTHFLPGAIADMGTYLALKWSGLGIVAFALSEYNWPGRPSSETIAIPKHPIIYEWNMRALNKGFSQITDEDLKRLKEDTGAQIIWFMGVWEESDYSRKLNKHYDDARVACAYAVHDYRINESLGGEGELRDLVRRAKRLGLKTMLDVVPNHMAADAPLLKTHPEFFMQPPEDLIARERPWVKLSPENELCPIFQEPETGRLFYFAKDPGFHRWGDIAQFNYANAGLRQYMKEMILRVADLTEGGGIRFDVVYLTFRENIKKNWFGRLSDAEFEKLYPAVDEFWKDTIAEVRQKNPGIVLIGEAYSGSGDRMAELGFDFYYENYFRDALKRGDVEGLRRFLAAVSSSGRFNFMKFVEDHDIFERIKNVLGKDAAMAAAVLLYTLPGATLIYHDQDKGRKSWVPSANYIRGPPETDDIELIEHYRKLAKLTSGEEFREGKCLPLNVGSGYGSPVMAKLQNMTYGLPPNKVIAFEREHNGKKSIVVVNYYDMPADFLIDVDGKTHEYHLPPWGYKIVNDDTQKTYGFGGAYLGTGLGGMEGLLELLQNFIKAKLTPKREKSREPTSSDENNIIVMPLTKELAIRHIDELIEVQNKAFEKTGEPVWGKDEFLADTIENGKVPLEKKWTYSQVAFYKGRIVGYLICYRRGDRAIASRFAVLPEFQRSVSATAMKLAKSGFQSILADGVEMVESKVDIGNPAIKLYEKAGFQVVGKVTRDERVYYQIVLNLITTRTSIRPNGLPQGSISKEGLLSGSLRFRLYRELPGQLKTDTLYRLIKEAFQDFGLPAPATFEDLDKFWRKVNEDTYRNALIAFIGDEPVALYDFAMSSASKESWTGFIYVDSRHQKKGIGGIVRQVLLDYLKQKGIEICTIPSIGKDRAAQALSESFIKKYPGTLKGPVRREDGLLAEFSVDLTEYDPDETIKALRKNLITETMPKNRRANGSIPYVFDVLTRPDNIHHAFTEEDIANLIIRRPRTVSYDISALVYLGLLTKVGLGKDVVYSIPEPVKECLDEIKPCLEKFRRELLRPTQEKLEPTKIEIQLILEDAAKLKEAVSGRDLLKVADEKIEIILDESKPFSERRTAIEELFRLYDITPERLAGISGSKDPVFIEETIEEQIGTLWSILSEARQKLLERTDLKKSDNRRLFKYITQKIQETDKRLQDLLNLTTEEKEDDNWVVRQRKLEEAVDKLGARAYPAVLKALEDEAEEVRIRAIELSGQHLITQAVDPIIKILNEYIAGKQSKLLRLPLAAIDALTEMMIKGGIREKDIGEALSGFYLNEKLPTLGKENARRAYQEHNDMGVEIMLRNFAKTAPRDKLTVVSLLDLIRQNKGDPAKPHYLPWEPRANVPREVYKVQSSGPEYPQTTDVHAAFLDGRFAGWVYFDIFEGEEKRGYIRYIERAEDLSRKGIAHALFASALEAFRRNGVHVAGSSIIERYEKAMGGQKETAEWRFWNMEVGVDNLQEVFYGQYQLNMRLVPPTSVPIPETGQISRANTAQDEDEICRKVFGAGPKSLRPKIDLQHICEGIITALEKAAIDDADKKKSRACIAEFLEGINAGRIKVIEFGGVVLTDQIDSTKARGWLLGFNTIPAPPGMPETDLSDALQKRLSEHFLNTVGLAREVLHQLEHNESLLQEYIFHEILCPCLGHEKTRILQEKLYPENYPNYITADMPAGHKDGYLAFVLKDVIGMENPSALEATKVWSRYWKVDGKLSSFGAETPPEPIQLFILNAFQAAASRHEIKSAIDIGCGNGYYIDQIIMKHFAPTEMVGLEPADITPPKSEGVTIVEARLETVDYKDKFDIALMNYVLMYIREKHKAIDKLNEMLKRGGRAVVIMHHPQSIILNEFREVNEYREAYIKFLKFLKFYTFYTQDDSGKWGENMHGLLERNKLARKPEEEKVLAGLLGDISKIRSALRRKTEGVEEEVKKFCAELDEEIELTSQKLYENKYVIGEAETIFPTFAEVKAFFESRGLRVVNSAAPDGIIRDGDKILAYGLVVEKPEAAPTRGGERFDEELGYTVRPLPDELLSQLPTMTIGERITAIREMRGMTKAQLRRRAGMASSTYVYVERRNELPNPGNLFKISKEIEVDPILIIKGRAWDEIATDLSASEKMYLLILRKGWTQVEFVLALEKAGLHFNTEDLGAKRALVSYWVSGTIPSSEEKRHIIEEVLGYKNIFTKRADEAIIKKSVSPKEKEVEKPEESEKPEEPFDEIRWRNTGQGYHKFFVRYVLNQLINIARKNHNWEIAARQLEISLEMDVLGGWVLAEAREGLTTPEMPIGKKNLSLPEMIMALPAVLKEANKIHPIEKGLYQRLMKKLNSLIGEIAEIEKMDENPPDLSEEEDLPDILDSESKNEGTLVIQERFMLERLQGVSKEEFTESFNLIKSIVEKVDREVSLKYGVNRITKPMILVEYPGLLPSFRVWFDRRLEVNSNFVKFIAYLKKKGLDKAPPLEDTIEGKQSNLISSIIHSIAIHEINHFKVQDGRIIYNPNDFSVQSQRGNSYLYINIEAMIFYWLCLMEGREGSALEKRVRTFMESNPHLFKGLTDSQQRSLLSELPKIAVTTSNMRPLASEYGPHPDDGLATDDFTRINWNAELSNLLGTLGGYAFELFDEKRPIPIQYGPYLIVFYPKGYPFPFGTREIEKFVPHLFFEIPITDKKPAIFYDIDGRETVFEYKVFLRNPWLSSGNEGGLIPANEEAVPQDVTASERHKTNVQRYLAAALVKSRGRENAEEALWNEAVKTYEDKEVERDYLEFIAALREMRKSGNRKELFEILNDLIVDRRPLVRIVAMENLQELGGWHSALIIAKAIKMLRRPQEELKEVQDIEALEGERKLTSEWASLDTIGRYRIVEFLSHALKDIKSKSFLFFPERLVSIYGLELYFKLYSDLLKRYHKLHPFLTEPLILTHMHEFIQTEMGILSLIAIFFFNKVPAFLAKALKLPLTMLERKLKKRRIIGEFDNERKKIIEEEVEHLRKHLGCDLDTEELNKISSRIKPSFNLKHAETRINKNGHSTIFIDPRLELLDFRIMLAHEVINYYKNEGFIKYAAIAVAVDILRLIEILGLEEARKFLKPQHIPAFDKGMAIAEKLDSEKYTEEINRLKDEFNKSKNPSNERDVLDIDEYGYEIAGIAYQFELNELDKDLGEYKAWHFLYLQERWFDVEAAQNANIQIFIYPYKEMPDKWGKDFIFSSKEATYLLAIDRQKDQLIGHRIAEVGRGKDDKPVVKCSNLWVDPYYQRRGIGTALLLETAKLAKEWCIDTIVFNVRKGNEAAIATYKKAARLLNAKLEEVESQEGVYSVTMTLPSEEKIGDGPQNATPQKESEPSPSPIKLEVPQEGTSPQSVWHESYHHYEFYNWLKAEIDNGRAKRGLPLILFDYHPDAAEEGDKETIYNWVRLAKEKGLIGDVYWVQPKGDNISIENNRPPEKDKKSMERYGFKLVTDSPDNLPTFFGGPVLVSIDFDYLSYTSFNKRPSREDIKTRILSIFDYLSRNKIQARVIDTTESGPIYVPEEDAKFISDQLNLVKGTAPAAKPDSTSEPLQSNGLSSIDSILFIYHISRDLWDRGSPFTAGVDLMAIVKNEQLLFAHFNNLRQIAERVETAIEKEQDRIKRIPEVTRYKEGLGFDAVQTHLYCAENNLIAEVLERHNYVTDRDHIDDMRKVIVVYAYLEGMDLDSLLESEFATTGSVSQDAGSVNQAVLPGNDDLAKLHGDFVQSSAIAKLQEPGFKVLLSEHLFRPEDVGPLTVELSKFGVEIVSPDKIRSESTNRDRPKGSFGCIITRDDFEIYWNGSHKNNNKAIMLVLNIDENPEARDRDYAYVYIEGLLDLITAMADKGEGRAERIRRCVNRLFNKDELDSNLLEEYLKDNDSLKFALSARLKLKPLEKLDPDRFDKYKENADTLLRAA